MKNVHKVRFPFSLTIRGLKKSQLDYEKPLFMKYPSLDED